MNKTFRRNLSSYKYFYLILTPIFLYYVIFHYLPMFGIVIAFKDYSPYRGFVESPWVGFKWFATLFQSSDFVRVFFNTILISVYSLIFYFPAPIIFAIMLNECKHNSFKRVIQSVSYLPHFISWAIMAGLLVTMLSPTTGIINQVLQLMGFKPIYFMIEPSYTRGLLIVSTIWKEMGFDSIIYLAALTSISPELYESATIDGASRFKQILYITLPGISNIIVLTLIFNVSNLLKLGFDQVYSIVLPTTLETGEVISTYTYRIGIAGSKFSFSSAVGLFQSVISILLLMTANAIARKFKEDGAVW